MQRVNNTDNHKPILRLPSREDFERVPAELRAEILKKLNVLSWNPDNFDIKIIREDEQYASHYIRRVESISAATNFFLTHLPVNRISEQALLRAPKNYSEKGKKISAAEALQGILQELNKTATEVCIDHLAKLNSGNIAHYQNSLYNYRKFITLSIATTLGIDAEEVTHALDRAEQFALLSTPRPVVCTISNLTENEAEYIAQVDEPLAPFTDSLKLELTNLKHGIKPSAEWYSSLDIYERTFLHAFLAQTKIEDLGTEINSISSRLRVMPAPSNYGKHTLITCLLDRNEQPEAITHAPEIRSSHIASRDVPRERMATRANHAIANLLAEVEEGIQTELAKRQNQPRTEKPIVIPILYQTLITPVRDPDTSLDEDKVTAIEKLNYNLSRRIFDLNGPNVSFVLIATNHPLNYGRVLAPIISPQNKDAAAALIRLVQDHGDPNDALLRDACDKLQRYSSEYSKILESYSELYLSTLEQIIIDMQGGISIGSCVSGKDRKAIEIVHTDAMKIYYSKYNSLPPLYAAKANENEKMAMKSFARIFADVYCTHHQAVMADFNAPGSFGTKTPEMYLPKHLSEAIKIRYRDPSISKSIEQRNVLKESDVLASNNDIAHIKQHKLAANEPNLSWRSSTYMPAVTLVHAAVLGFDEYHATRANNLGLLAGLWGSQHGDTRALCYETLLRDPTLAGDSREDQTLDTIVKVVILYALLTTDSSKHLKATILNRSQTPSIDTALEIMKNFLEFELRDTKYDMKNIFDLAKRIQKRVEALESPKSIEACCDAIKQDLQPLIANLIRLQTSSESNNSMQLK